MELTWMLTILDSKIRSIGDTLTSQGNILSQEEKGLFWRSCHDLSPWTTIASCKGEIRSKTLPDIVFIVHGGGDWDMVTNILQAEGSSSALCMQVSRINMFLKIFDFMILVQNSSDLPFRQFLDNWDDLERYCGYRENNIPQLEDINR